MELPRPKASAVDPTTNPAPSDQLLPTMWKDRLAGSAMPQLYAREPDKSVRMSLGSTVRGWGFLIFLRGALSNSSSGLPPGIEMRFGGRPWMDALSQSVGRDEAPRWTGSSI